MPALLIARSSAPPNSFAANGQQVGAVLGDGDVGREGQDGVGPRAGLDQAVGDLAQAVGRAGGQDHARASADQRLGQGPAQAHRGPGHQAAGIVESAAGHVRLGLRSEEGEGESSAMRRSALI